MHIVPMREEPVRKVSAKYHVTGQVSRNHNGGLDAVRWWWNRHWPRRSPCGFYQRRSVTVFLGKTQDLKLANEVHESLSMTAPLSRRNKTQHSHGRPAVLIRLTLLRAGRT